MSLNKDDGSKKENKSPSATKKGILNAGTAKVWIHKEIRDILACPITVTALWMGILAFSNQAYRWYNHKLDWVNLNVNDEVFQIINNKPKNLSQATKKVIYFEIKKVLEQLSMDKAEVESISRWLLTRIEESWLLDDTLPKPKPGWLSALFALIYIYLYTKTIRKIRLDHSTVSTFSFAWFSILNWWFAISNWILDPWSLGYLSACIMWAITVAVNQIEIRKQSKNKASLDVQKILLDFAIWEKNPVVIYKWDKGSADSDFPNEKPLFWNPAMEKISWYTHEEVKEMTQYEIMQLLYSYDEKVFNNVIRHLTWVSSSWFWYKNRIFPLQTKAWDIVDVAWHTEKVPWGWRISFWSIDQMEIQNTLRKDPVFDCNNVLALKQDFVSIISHFWNLEGLSDKHKVLSMIYCDLDYFKNINENYGHLFWDIVLDEYIKFIKWEFRKKDDNIYRKIWDEFVIVYNFADKDSVINRVESMKEHLSRLTIIVEFKWWVFEIKHLKHWSSWAAKAYHNANVFINKLSLKKYNTWDKWEYRIVLPQIWSSWWITDYHYNNATLATIDTDKMVDKLINQANKAKYESKKKWKNSVTVFQIDMEQDRL
ncbi:MAG: response regulator receiver modulated diguanylate cyclase [uncultured bacterium (gcode 4)]|uniref:Response regulator receiver modulated diguanylate cyclase n=1 Tax=uncultured bacterium (gcode 4) TaxID=1234023 RepID=K2G0L9_9BACT|nr:MAG: response regulator receiver modulated diguanylate cyclase [uncultured bacterium (gcode 4)]